jgi:hypothetical protein
MKRAFWLTTLGLTMIAMTGCNRGWPSLFCLRDPGYEVIEQCDPCTTYYGGEVVGEGWISEPTVETLPGPARS